VQQGLAAKESCEREGREVKSHRGREVRELWDRRSIDRFLQGTKGTLGREVSRLLVTMRVSSAEGSGMSSGMEEIWLFARETIVRFGQEETASEGKIAKLQLSRRIVLRFGRAAPRLDGREERPVPERSRVVRDRPRERISSGKEVKGEASLRCVRLASRYPPCWRVMRS